MRREIEGWATNLAATPVNEGRMGFSCTATEYDASPVSMQLAVAEEVLQRFADLSFVDAGFFGAPQGAIESTYKADANTTIDARLAYYKPLWRNQHGTLSIFKYQTIKVWTRKVNSPDYEQNEFKALGEIELFPRLYKWPDTLKPYYLIEPQFHLGTEPIAANDERAGQMLDIINKAVSELLPR